ncbi:type III-B CRISPR module RAMP protein Cmr1 [Thermoanaerobacterium thermosaccharolyticum]|uniref:type III-B CRISPR module RAMP protein Cmr1 n=1 Tax=Thermoanaerobacterium thermosaccharolyticum TaxID=1517 RepID=UPI003DA846BA
MGFYKIVLDCECVTPIFNSGINTNEFELRASSLKGMIRYWWRAARPDLKLEKLAKVESYIFGGTGKEDGKSKVSLKVYGYDDSAITYDSSNFSNYDGIKYLFYSLLLPGKQRPYLKPCSNFKIELVSKDITMLNEFIKGLLIIQYFGGVGSRTRRGAGSFVINQIDGDKENLKYLDFFNTRNISNKADLRDLYKHILNDINSTNILQYTVISNCNINIFNPYSQWDMALESIGLLFRNFRYNYKSSIYDTPNFGIPIIHKHGNRPKMIAVKINNSNVKSKCEKITRRASPLILKVVKCNNMYYPVVIYLKNTYFLPKWYEIVNENDLPSKKNNYTADPNMKLVRPNSWIIKQFLRTLPADREVL